jgi:hypothetical protein
MELYQRVFLIENIDRYGLKKGDVATLVDFVDHPQAGEKGCVLEIKCRTGALTRTSLTLVHPLPAFGRERVN